MKKRLQKYVLKKFSFVFLLSLLSILGMENSFGQVVVFSQNFNSATTVTLTTGAATAITTASGNNIVGSTAASQLTSITCNAKSSCGIGINDASHTGKFYAGGANTSFNWSAVKTTNFSATAPTALKIEITAAWIVGSSSSNAAGVDFAVGSGFADGYTSAEPAVGIVHSGFTLQNNSTSKVAVYGTPATTLSASGVTQTTSLKLTWVINNSASTISYTNPAGGSTNLAADKWDLWQGTTQFVTAASALTGSVDLQNFYMGNVGAKNNNITIDDITATDLLASASASTDYFRSKTSGNWSSTSTWESSSDNNTWINATLVPDNSANTITVQGSHTVTLDVNKSVSNTTIAATGILNVAPSIILTVPLGKTVTNNGTFTLKSDATGTGNIGNSAGAIAGNVTVQRFIAGGASAGTPGKRAFRFLSHPFSSYTDLTQLTNQIDVTGSGATAVPSAANFTQSGSNAASAFWFDPLAADNATNDAGWQAFTNTLPASGTDANAWKVGQGIRVLVRGAKGEGLAGGTYAASPVTLSMSGAVNVATSPIAATLTSNLIAGGGWNLVGNPLPSSIEIQAKLKALRTANIGGTNSNLGATAYVWNANKTGSTRGGYDAIDLTAASTYSLPMNGVVLVQTTTNNNAALSFSESDKTATAGTGLFRTTGANNAIALEMYDASGNQLDETFIRFNNKTDLKFESNDGGKLLNEYALYTTTSDNIKAYINSQPEPAAETKIPVGIYSGVAKDFVLKASELNLPVGTTVYLKDNFLNKQEAITGTGYSYAFSTTANTASSGANRFELVFGKSVVPAVALASTFSVKLSPNPATDIVKVNFSNETKANTVISVVNAAGKTVKTVDAGNVQSGNINIYVKGFAKGNYYVTLNNGTEKKTEKLVIQ